MPKRHKTLVDLRRATLEVKKWIEKNPNLDLTEQMHIENSIEVLRIAYAAWRIRKEPRTPSQPVTL